MKKITFLLLSMITVQTNAMLVPTFPKEINVCIRDHVLSSSSFSSLEEVNNTLTNLLIINKSWNLFVNNSQNTLSLIKKLSHRFDLSDMEVATFLCTDGARNRYAIQMAAEAHWRSGKKFIHSNLIKLLPSLDLNFTNDQGYIGISTMLMRACYIQDLGYSDVAECLIKCGADINVMTKDRKTASSFAFYFFKEELIPLFLNHKDFKINHQDDDGNTYLHCCFQKGITVDGYPRAIDIKKCGRICPIIKQLLEKGIDRHAVNSAGETALALAKKTGHKPFLDILNSYNSSIEETA